MDNKFEKWSKKIGTWGMLFVFIVIICSLRIWEMILGTHIDSENHENRALAEEPKLSINNFYTFPKSYTYYYNDRVPFRNSFVCLNSTIDYNIFQKTVDERVIIGLDHWLYYTDAEDGDPIGCYQGTNLFSEEQLQTIAQNCLNIQEYLKGEGKEFVLYIVPDKTRIYYEFLPTRYGLPAENNKVMQLYDYLNANTDLRVVYPIKELYEAKNQRRENIYCKADTHWNSIGAYVGAVALLKELGITIPDIYDNTIMIRKGENIAGDLADLLNLSEQFKKYDTDYIIEGYNEHNCEELEMDFREKYVFRAEGGDTRKIYMIRDSFATAMAYYIGSQFNDSYMRYKGTYTYNDYLEQDPDIIVYETTERYVDGLLDFSFWEQDQENNSVIKVD